MYEVAGSPGLSSIAFAGPVLAKLPGADDLQLAAGQRVAAMQVTPGFFQTLFAAVLGLGPAEEILPQPPGMQGHLPPASPVSGM